MNTRRLLLAALLATAFSAGGCTGYAEPPKDEEKPKAGELPQAPLPRVKKMTAELLVGSWKVVTVGGHPVAKDYERISEFTADGKFTFQVVKWHHPTLPPLEWGTYRVDGKMIRFDREPNSERAGDSWSGMIEEVTEDKLVVSAKLGKERQKSEYVRVKSK